uniref:Uncharacterized protein n=1 Tax=Arundo donax TaxID=35708 RepID=A0A0A9HBY1_ARUDO
MLSEERHRSPRAVDGERGINLSLNMVLPRSIPTTFSQPCCNRNKFSTCCVLSTLDEFENSSSPASFFPELKTQSQSMTTTKK